MHIPGYPDTQAMRDDARLQLGLKRRSALARRMLAVAAILFLVAFLVMPVIEPGRAVWFVQQLMEADGYAGPVGARATLVTVSVWAMFFVILLSIVLCLILCIRLAPSVTTVNIAVLTLGALQLSHIYSIRVIVGARLHFFEMIPVLYLMGGALFGIGAAWRARWEIRRRGHLAPPS
ncbi:hypothetical protein EAX62_09505 [Tessaracoccus antarcticus]|uniref:Uncharacterized protein n=2 Tax=Tessaracoccus antarcticus TaxID=2479848 RepID=A0A3M0G541_9ACTN|nr:hypothetical protein EAX62_09505 [Tessaracoccus antarcticus]